MSFLSQPILPGGIGTLLAESASGILEGAVVLANGVVNGAAGAVMGIGGAVADLAPNMPRFDQSVSAPATEMAQTRAPDISEPTISVAKHVSEAELGGFSAPQFASYGARSNDGLQIG
ncbi:MAG: hypothetical protein ACOYNL_05930 [Rickettsiales bacterium]